MHIHAINLPRFVIVGPNVLPKVRDILNRLNYTGSILLICGETFTKEPAKVVMESIEDSARTVHMLSIKDATQCEVEEVASLIEETKAGMVVSVGGGKTIDVAKLASYNKNIPFISVPTSAAHDGISSPVASLKRENGSTSVMAHPPIALLADTEVIAKSPKRHIVSGVGDIIAKFTAVRDWGLAHRLKGEYYGEYAASLALMSAELVKENIEFIARGLDVGVRTLIEALISCGYAMCIAGSSRPCSGSEHLFAHALERIAGDRAFHGERCGLGAIMMMYLHGGDWRSIKDVLSKVGGPTTAKQLGVRDEQIVEAMTLAHTIRAERYTILGEKGITKEAAIEVAKITGVID
ncbi:MAG: NAD(P)-dependent glycerol-1-phosphate dehydrogenase [Candidatus Methanomethylicaceae archaeon]